MLNTVNFTTNSSSSSTTTTPRRRNRRKGSNDSVISDTSTSSTISSGYNSVAKAKRKVQLKKEERLNRYIEENDDLLKKAQDLRDFAKSECGLINDAIRAKVWPVLAETINDQDDVSVSDESSSSCSDSDFETALSSFSFSDDGSGNIAEKYVDVCLNSFVTSFYINFCRKSHHWKNSRVTQNGIKYKWMYIGHSRDFHQEHLQMKEFLCKRI